MALINLYTVQHTNPGAVPLGARPLPVQIDNESDNDDQSLLDGQVVSTVSRRRGIRRCRKCNNNYKPPRSHHDSVTGRCIVKFDHFCPWAGNAIGALNHKFFFLFILYTFLTSILSLFLLILRFIQCGYKVSYEHASEDSGTGGGDDGIASTTMNEYIVSTNNDTFAGIDSENSTFSGNQTLRFLLTDDDDDDDNFDYLYGGCHELYSPRVALLVILSIAFTIFTCCMLIEQADAIESNTSKIARMKIAMGQNENGEYDRKTEQCNEMFGIGIAGMSDGSCCHAVMGGNRGANVAFHWFLPTPVRFPEGKLDAVLGFEYRDEWYGKIYQESMDEEDVDIMEARGSDVENPLELQHKESSGLGTAIALATHMDLEGKEIRNRNLLPSSSSFLDKVKPKEVVVEMNKVVEMKRVSSTRSNSIISKRSAGGTSNVGSKLGEEYEDASQSDTSLAKIV